MIGMPHSFDMERDLIEGNYPWDKGNANTSYISNGGSCASATTSATSIGNYALFGGAESNSNVAHKLTSGSIDPNTAKLSDLSEVEDDNGLYRPGRYIGINGKAIPVDKIKDGEYRPTLKYMGVENFTSELPGKDNNVGDLRYVREDQGMYCWDGNLWVKLAKDPNNLIHIPITVVKHTKSHELKYDPNIINQYGQEVIDDVLYLDTYDDISSISVTELRPYAPSLSVLIVCYIALIGVGSTFTGYLNLLARILTGLFVGVTLKLREREPVYGYIVNVTNRTLFDPESFYGKKFRERYKIKQLSSKQYILERIIYKYNYPF